MANNKIFIKRTGTSGTRPTTSNISNAELAINVTDGILFSTNGTTIFEIGANTTNSTVSNTLTVGSGSSNGKISANGTTGTAGQVLTSGGSANNIYWSTPSGSFSNGTAYDWSAVQTFNANVAFSNTRISANGGFGSAGQVLTSSGTGANVYWRSINSASYNWSQTQTFDSDVTFSQDIIIADGRSIEFNDGNGNALRIQGVATPSDYTSNKDILIPNRSGTVFVTGYSTTATAGGTTTLTDASNYYQTFTGSTTQTVRMPAGSQISNGVSYEIENNSTGNITVTSNNNSTVGTVLPGTKAHVLMINSVASTTAAAWDFNVVGFNTVTGTGSAVLSTSPTLTTPNIGAATGTSLTTTGGGVLARAAATQDGVEIRGRAGGTGNWEVILTPISGGLTADRTLSLPDATGTVVVTGTTDTVSNTMLAGSIPDSKLNQITTANKVALSSLTSDTTTAIGVGSINLGHASDTTLARSSAGVITVENVEVVDVSRSQTLTNKQVRSPVSTTTGLLTAADANKSLRVTAGITVNTGVFTAGDIMVIYNDSASNITLTANTGVTMRLAGGTTTGNRTLAQRGIATMYFVSATEVAVGGTGVT